MVRLPTLHLRPVVPDTDAAAPPKHPGLHTLLADAAATLDANDRVTGWNSAAVARFAVPVERALGLPLDEVPAAATDDALVRLPLEGGGTLVVWHADEPPGPDQILLAKAHALEFLAGPVQHDLANPLNALMLFGQMVELEGGVPDDMTSDITQLADAAERAYRLVRTMLEVTRSRPFTPQAVLVSTLASELLELLAYLLVDVTVETDVPGTLPEVEADPTSLRLALVLVLLNSIRALGGPKARGRLRFTGHGTEDGSAVDLVVADSAPPVGDDERAHLFDGLPPGTGAIRAGSDLAAARALLRRDGGDLRYERGADGTNRLVLVVPQYGHRDEALARALAGAIEGEHVPEGLAGEVTGA
jgi:signal transduction histidine kinase